MSLKLYNTLTNKKEIFEPIEQGKVGMYVCGVTVYDNCHLGHARAYVAFDILVRYFRYQGYKVNYVRNITDIEDKIIERANENSESIYDLTSRTIASMHADFQGLGLIEPNSEPKATEYIDGMVTMIEDLIAKGHAYVADNNDVFFSVRSYEEYGKLSNKVLDDLDPGSRISEDQAKADPLDFVLWKSAKPEEPSWDSPWGKGRPGWHIECSVMSLEKLGKNFDIHGGGPDLIFPHHENEIAQSKGVDSQENFVNYWLHNGMLNLSGKKMSKSDGNVKLLNEYIDEYSGEVVRFFFLRAHYRSPQEFSEQLLQEAKKTLSNLTEFTKEVVAEPNDRGLVDIFVKCMNDDMNTPKLLGEIFQKIKDTNGLDQENTIKIKQTVKFIFGILGFELKTSKQKIVDKRVLSEFFQKYNIKFNDIDSAMSDFRDKREKLRNNKQYGEADKMREDLLEIGIVMNDGENVGWYWKNS